MADEEKVLTPTQAATPVGAATQQTKAATEQRIATFGKFFKGYMSVSAFVTAALPIPMTAIGLIPTYSAMKGPLSTFTSLFCFLLLGFIFYQRHSLARTMFYGLVTKGEADQKAFDFKNLNEMGKDQVRLKEKIQNNRKAFISMLPMFLILSSFFCAFFYLRTISGSIAMLREEVIQELHPRTSGSPSANSPSYYHSVTVPTSIKFDVFLKEEELDQIPLANDLVLLYLAGR